MNDKDLFVGKLNSRKKKNYILFTLLIFILFFPIILLNELVAVLIICVFLSLLILILIKVNINDNLLVFDIENVLLRKKEIIIEKFEYDNLKSVFFFFSTEDHYVELKFENKKYIVIIDTKKGFGYNQLKFIEFLFERNRKILITERQSNFETFKYFILRDEVKRVLVD